MTIGLRVLSAVLVTATALVGVGSGGREALAQTVGAEQETVVVVVGRGDRPVSSDRAIIDRIRQGGRTVEVVDDADLTTAQVDLADLVLVTDTAQASLVAGKVEATATTVAAFKAGLFEALGFVRPGGDAGGIGGTRRLTITDPTHPLAGGLSGTVTVLRRNSTVSYADIGDAGTMVASRGSSGTQRALIFAYETGELLSNGEVAPGRRIGSFLARGAVNHLTDEGWTLFDAMIDHGLAGGSVGNRSPVVDDQRFTVADDAAAGDAIGTVDAADPDGDDLSFSLDDETVVGIDPVTGQLTVVAPGGLVGGTELVLEVTVTDPQGATGTAVVTVEVTESSGQGPTLTITSHTDGQRIDIGADGVLPMLQGVVEEDGSTVEEVVIEAGGESASAGLYRPGDGTVRWFLPIGAPASGPVDYIVTVRTTAGATATGELTLDLVAPDATDIVVSPFVVVLDDQPAHEVVSLDATTGELVVLMDPSTILPGSILIGAPFEGFPSGFARRIDEISSVDDTRLVAVTSRARWDEIFYQVAAPAGGGAELQAQRLSAFVEPPVSQAAADLTGSLSLSQSLPTQSLSHSIAVGPGSLDFNGQLVSLVTARLQIQAEWTLLGGPQVDIVDFGAAVQGTANGTMTLGVSAAASGSDSIELFEQRLASGLFAVGPVPVYWEVEAEADLTGSASASASASIEGSVSAPFRLGLELNAAGDGVEPVTDFGLNGGGVQPTLEGELSATVSIDPD